MNHNIGIRIKDEKLYKLYNFSDYRKYSNFTLYWAVLVKRFWAKRSLIKLTFYANSGCGDELLKGINDDFWGGGQKNVHKFGLVPCTPIVRTIFNLLKKRRYGLSSTFSSTISLVYNASSIFGLVFTTVFGNRIHRPFWLGIGGLMVALGAFINTLPQWLSGITSKILKISI